MFRLRLRRARPSVTKAPCNNAAPRRVVIKLSGEFLAGSQSFGIDQPTIDRVADDLIAAQKLGIEVAVRTERPGSRPDRRQRRTQVVRHRLEEGRLQGVALDLPCHSPEHGRRVAWATRCGT